MILKKDAENDMDRESKQWENIKGNGNKKGIIHRIRNRQLKFIGSTREEGLENFSLKGHIEGSGRKRDTYLKSLFEWTTERWEGGLRKCESLIRATRDGVLWREMKGHVM